MTAVLHHRSVAVTVTVCGRLCYNAACHTRSSNMRPVPSPTFRRFACVRFVCTGEGAHFGLFNSTEQNRSVNKYRKCPLCTIVYNIPAHSGCHTLQNAASYRNSDGLHEILIHLIQLCPLKMHVPVFYLHGQELCLTRFFFLFGLTQIHTTFANKIYCKTSNSSIRVKIKKKS